MTGTDMLHVPYKGDAPLSQALLAGEVQLAFMPLAGVLPHIRSGRLRALGSERHGALATLPEVPTLTEGGVPFEFTGWLGVLRRRLGARHRESGSSATLPRRSLRRTCTSAGPRGATNRSAARPSNSRKIRGRPREVRQSDSRIGHSLAD